MISRIHLSIILLLASLICGILLIIDGVAVSISWLRYLSIVTGILLLLLAAFDIWLWRLPFLQGWFVERPDISGTWRATIRSTWPSTDKMIEPVEGYMAIRQTFSLLSLRLMTDESASELLAAEIIHSPDNTFRVAGVYRNEPKLLVRHRSPIHHGALLLQIVGAPATAFNGYYWTDRKTAGELKLTDRRKKIFYDFETAKQMFNTGHHQHATEPEG